MTISLVHWERAHDKTEHNPKTFLRYSIVNKAEEIAQSYNNKFLDITQLGNKLKTSRVPLAFKIFLV